MKNLIKILKKNNIYKKRTYEINMNVKITLHINEL